MSIAEIPVPDPCFLDLAALADEVVNLADLPLLWLCGPDTPDPGADCQQCPQDDPSLAAVTLAYRRYLGAGQIAQIPTTVPICLDCLRIAAITALNDKAVDLRVYVPTVIATMTTKEELIK